MQEAHRRSFASRSARNANLRFPVWDVDGSGQDPNRVGLEVLFTMERKDVFCPKGEVATSIVDHFAPHLEYPQAPHKRFVERSSREVVQVVEVSCECDATVARKFFCASFRFSDYRQRRQGESVGRVDGGIDAVRASDATQLHPRPRNTSHARHFRGDIFLHDPHAGVRRQWVDR